MGLSREDVRLLFRFGPFEFDAESGELRRHGVRVHLQPKAQQLLAILLDNAGAIVTREELQRRLWSDGTFVDFESGLNTTANRLRLKLSDSAVRPRYIETLPRVGYRFIGAVDRGEAAVPVPAVPARQPRRFRGWLAAGAAALALALIAWLVPLRQPAAQQVRFRELTFRRGQVGGARFSGDGQTVIYAAQWEAGPGQLYMVAGGGPESRPIGFTGFSLAGVSDKAELALLQFGGTMNIAGGALYRVPATGTAPAFVDRGVMGADWIAGEDGFVVVRAAGGENRLEVPAGTVVYKTTGWLSSVRAAPAGDRVAFVEHPFRHGEAGRVMLFEAGKGVRAISENWDSVAGLAWHPGRGEIWFTASRGDVPRSLWAARDSGSARLVAQAPGVLTLRDIAPGGKVLLSRDTRRLEVAGALGTNVREQDFSWLDWSRVQELSADGRYLLFDESGEAVGNRLVAYVRDNRTGSVTRLGEGMAMGLSPDGRSALVAGPDRERLALAPLSGGSFRWLPSAGLRYQWARFFPDGRRLLALAARGGEGLRLYVHAPDGTGAAPLSREMMIRNAVISPDGGAVAVLSPANELLLFDVARGGEPRTIPTTEPLAPIRWMRGGRTIIVQHLRRARDSSAQLSRLDVATGQLTPWKKLAPADPVGVNSITGVVLSEDGTAYMYSYRRVLSELFAVDGWR